MEKKYWSALLVGVLLICLFWGCSFNNNTVKNANGNSEEVLPTPETEDRWENTPLMTREYLLEHGLATEEDLEQIDVEYMIKDCDWHEGDEEEDNIALLFSDLKSDYLLDEYVIDYSYLVETDKSEESFTEEDIEQIKIVAYVYNSGTYNSSMVFDFSERKAYFDDDGRLLERIPCPEEYIELSDEQIAEIKNLMRDCGVTEWKKRYEGTNKDSTGWYWWYLCYELEDGRIYSNSGQGAAGPVRPEGQSVLEESFDKFFDSIK
jgi:hypothetical protein